MKMAELPEIAKLSGQMRDALKGLDRRMQP